jgi:hypothetical protein
MFMDTAICGFAPTEKSEPPACRCSFLEELEIDMELKNEARTLVHINEDDQVVVSQPDEMCAHCDAYGMSFVYLSPQRARMVAAEMLRLADEIEAK